MSKAASDGAAEELTWQELVVLTRLARKTASRLALQAVQEQDTISSHHYPGYIEELRKNAQQMRTIANKLSKMVSEHK